MPLALFLFFRISTAMATLLMVSFIVFGLMELSPVQYAERCWQFRPLNEDFLVRWVKWVTDVFLRGDFGFSCIINKPINILLADKFWVSLGLCLSSLALAYALAIPLGIYSATSKSRLVNNSARFLSYLGLAIPNFLLALLIVLARAVYFNETPSGLVSREFLGAPLSVEKALNFLSNAWIPIIVLGWSSTAIALQSVRALVSEEIEKPYVMAARARGIAGQRLLWRYPARHALGPVFNSLGFDLNRVFNELPVIAFILTLSDAGALLLEALVRSNDQPLAATIILLLTASIISLNLITDIILAFVDPRFREGLIGL